MKKNAGCIVGGILGMLVLPMTVHAANGDLELIPQSIKFSPEQVIEGRKTRIYATSKSNSKDDLYGIVRFTDNNTGNIIGSDQPISVFSGRTDDVFVDWIPGSGEHQISIKIIPWQGGDNANNNSTTVKINVMADMDHDGISDNIDKDIDGDGILNDVDAFPGDPSESKDTDGDGIGDNKDPDIDGDGIPNDTEVKNGTDPLKTDTDGDGITDDKDAFPLDPKEWKDTDGDGIGDNSDPDIDGDGIPNAVEIKNGTDPLKTDTDGDGVPDNKDVLPLDPKESKDTNHNGIPDHKDPDIDGDGIPNAKDPFPANLAPHIENASTPFIINIKDIMHLDATPSIDPDGKIVKVAWIVDGKKKYEGIKQDIQLEGTGSHEVELQVTDNSGETVSKKLNLYGTASVLLAQGGIPAALIALALLGLFYYIVRARRKRAKQKKAEKPHEQK